MNIIVYLTEILTRSAFTYLWSAVNIFHVHKKICSHGSNDDAWMNREYQENAFSLASLISLLLLLLPIILKTEPISTIIWILMSIHNIHHSVIKCIFTWESKVYIHIIVLTIRNKMDAYSSTTRTRYNGECLKKMPPSLGNVMDSSGDIWKRKSYRMKFIHLLGHSRDRRILKNPVEGVWVESMNAMNTKAGASQPSSGLFVYHTIHTVKSMWWL